MLPIGQIGKLTQQAKGAILNTLRDPVIQKRVLFLLFGTPQGRRIINESSTTIVENVSEFASTYRVRLDNGEIETKNVVQSVEKTYKVGNVSNADVIQGEGIIKCESIINNTTININITVRNFEEIMKMLPEIPKLRSQLENNLQKFGNNIQTYEDLKLFANNDLDPFLGKIEKILSESVEYIN